MGLFPVEKLCERERSVALVSSHRKCAYLGLHIKQNAGGTEVSCPVMLRAAYKPDYKENLCALENGSYSPGLGRSASELPLTPGILCSSYALWAGVVTYISLNCKGLGPLEASKALLQA